MKKYEITDIVMKLGSRELYRIRSLVDIPKINLRKGELGGWVENESNLSQTGTCWIFNDAKVFDNGLVYENSLVMDESRVYRNSKCYGNSIISGFSLVSNYSECYGNCVVSENSLVFNHAKVCGDSELCGIAEVSNRRYYNSGLLNTKYITQEDLERIAEWKDAKKRKQLAEIYNV